MWLIQKQVLESKINFVKKWNVTGGTKFVNILPKFFEIFEYFKFSAKSLIMYSERLMLANMVSKLVPNILSTCHFAEPILWVGFRQGILKGEVSLYHWPPVWLVWNQLYDNWNFLFLFAKQTNPNQSNRRSTVQWHFPL